MESNMNEKQIIEIVIDELKRKNLIREVKSSFQLTEQALYLVPKIKQAIKNNQKEIKYLQQHGMPSKSGSVTSISSGGPRLEKQEMLEAKINCIIQANILNESYIKKIEDIILTQKDHKYYEIINMKYFENKTNDQIAEKFCCDEKTIRRNKNFLINEIKSILLPNNSINEIGY